MIATIWNWLAHASLEDWELRLVWLAALPQTFYVLGFGTKNQWWASLIGWSQFTKALAVALLLDMSIYQVLFGPPPGVRWIGLAIIALLAVGAWLQAISWVVDRRRERRERRLA